MNIYPKDSALLKIEDYNTYFKIRASQTLFSYSAKLKGWNNNLLASANFNYDGEQFKLRNKVSQNLFYKTKASFRFDENMKVFLYSQDVSDFFNTFSLGFRLTLEQQYNMYVQYNKVQEQSDFQFYAKVNYNWEEWKMKTIIQATLKDKKLNLTSLCQYAIYQHQIIKFLISKNESSIMIESPFKNNTKLAFRIQKTIKQKQETKFDCGVKHLFNDRFSLISKINQEGSGLIGFEGKYKQVDFLISNRFSLKQPGNLNFPFQFRIQLSC